MKEFNEIKKEMIQAYVDNFSADDTNQQVESWLQDSYPQLDVTVNNKLMSKDYSVDDVIDNGEIIKINNESEIQNSEFALDGDQWIAKA